MTNEEIVRGLRSINGLPLSALIGYHDMLCAAIERLTPKKIENSGRVAAERAVVEVARRICSGELGPAELALANLAVALHSLDAIGTPPDDAAAQPDPSAIEAARAWVVRNFAIENYASTIIRALDDSAALASCQRARRAAEEDVKQLRCECEVHEEDTGRTRGECTVLTAEVVRLTAERDRLQEFVNDLTAGAREHVPALTCAEILALAAERDRLAGQVAGFVAVCRKTVDQFDSDQGDFAGSDDSDETLTRDAAEPGHLWEVYVDIEVMRALLDGDAKELT